MSNLAIILGVLISLNLFVAMRNLNWHAAGGWIVAGMEWLRRLT